MDISQLSQDVLAIVLASLDHLDLKTAPLVCRAFRSASVPCITRLSYDCENKGSDSEASAASEDEEHPTSHPSILADRLQRFPCVKHLHLRITQPFDEPVLEVPAVRSTLCSLELMAREDWEMGEPDPHSLEALTPRLAQASRLTPLSVEMRGLPDTGRQLGHYLGASMVLELVMA